MHQSFDSVQNKEQETLRLVTAYSNTLFVSFCGFACSYIPYSQDLLFHAVLEIAAQSDEEDCCLLWLFEVGDAREESIRCSAIASRKSMWESRCFGSEIIQ